jgi:hypothetical protein
MGEKSLINTKNTGNNNQKILPDIPQDLLLALTRKNWMSHDARWQMTIVCEFGWEMGNKLNQIVIKQMGKTMMQRLKKNIEMPAIRTIKNLQKIWVEASELFWASHSKDIFSFPTENEVKITVHECKTNTNVRKAGVENEYQCGCFALREGIFDALSIKSQQSVRKCLKDGDNCCEISIKVEKLP